MTSTAESTTTEKAKLVDISKPDPFQINEYITLLKENDEKHVEAIIALNNHTLHLIPLSNENVEELKQWQEQRNSIFEGYCVKLKDMAKANTFVYPEELEYMRDNERDFTDFFRAVRTTKRAQIINPMEFDVKNVASQLLDNVKNINPLNAYEVLLEAYICCTCKTLIKGNLSSVPSDFLDETLKAIHQSIGRAPSFSHFKPAQFTKKETEH